MKKLTAVFLLLALVLGLAGCAGKSNSYASLCAAQARYPDAYGFEDYDAFRRVVDENPVEDSFFAAVNQFSYETAAQLLAGKDGNTLYSPLSLYFALALTASGAGGQTQAELLALLGADYSADDLARQAGNLYRLLYRDNEIAKLKIANSLWLREGMEFKDGFLETAADDFYASMFRADFSDEKTGEAIAAWVSDNTVGTLDYGFEPNPEQVMSLINTIYFYDQWTDRFDKSKTAPDEFHLANGQTVTCDFMNRTYGSHSFAKGEGFTRSSLGLKDSGSMVFILPDEGVSCAALLASAANVEALFNGGQTQNGEVVWQIPKFSYGAALDLKETLRALGVESAFSQDADFSAIADGTLLLSSVRQNTHISIDERGVEASAYTEIGYVGAAMPEGRAEMILDRPFLYGIVDRGVLLFVGVFGDPTA